MTGTALSWLVIQPRPGQVGEAWRARILETVRKFAPALRHWQGEPRLLVAESQVDAVWPPVGPPRLLMLGQTRSHSRYGSQRLGEPGLPLSAGAPSETIASLLSKRVWGRYVGVLPEADDIALFPDPAGGRAAYAIVCEAGVVAAEDCPRWLWEAAGMRPSIDATALGLALADPVHACHAALFENARLLAPGALHRLGSGETTPIWSLSMLAADPIDPADPTAVLRETVTAVVTAEGEDPALVQLSGGLDSSIVLAARVASGAPVTAATMATAHAGGDERQWARLAAAHLGVHLVEIAAVPRPIDHARLRRLAHPMRPFLYGLDDHFEGGMAEAANSCGASVILTGQGGDDLFGEMPTPLIAADRVRGLGLAGLRRHDLLADAERSNHSIWSPLRAVILDCLGRLPPRPEPTMPAFLVPEVRNAARRGIVVHPWLDDGAGLPPAKLLQLRQLANTQILQMPRPHADVVQVRHPLLAQPMLELAARLPLYRLAYGERDRALARDAYAGHLPSAILTRRVKGEASDHYSRALRDDLSALQELLIDGALGALGLIDRAAARRILDPVHLAHSLDYRGLAVAASLAAWAEHWR